MTWLRKLLAYLFRPSLALLERKASELGSLSLHQVHNGGGLEWWCDLRSNAKGDPLVRRYVWKGHGPTIREAIADAILEAEQHPIGAKPLMPDAPKLGGKEYDA